MGQSLKRKIAPDAARNVESVGIDSEGRHGDSTHGTLSFKRHARLVPPLSRASSLKPIITCLVLLSSTPFASPCTIFTASQGDTVLVGNNEDYNDDNVSIDFYPAAKGKYGRMLLKIKRNGYPFGGMNDKGLFFDWCALPRRSDISFPKDKKTYKGILCEKMLAECATVDEAIELYNAYNDPWLYEGHIMIVDRSGESAVIEWGETELSIIRKTGNFQVLSNFNLTSPHLAGWYPCPRYDNAAKMLREAPEYSVGLLKKILDKVHQEGEYPTIHSEIYELGTGIVRVFLHHDFNAEVRINLRDELAKGRKTYILLDLFRR